MPCRQFERAVRYPHFSQLRGNLGVFGEDHYLMSLPWVFSWISVNVSFVVGMQNAHCCSAMMDWTGFF